MVVIWVPASCQVVLGVSLGVVHHPTDNSPIFHTCNPYSPSFSSLNIFIR